MSDPTARHGFKRRLALAGVIAGAGAVILVVTGIVERDRSSAKLQDWTEAQAIPTVAIVALNAEARRGEPEPARPVGGQSARADLCAGQRLREGLEGRHRRRGQGRTDARRDRGARPRPAVAAGARRPDQRRSQRQTFGGHAVARADAADFGRRFPAGRRSARGRPRQQAGRGPFQRSQCRAPRGSGGLQDGRRAVRRRRHRAQHRRRRADQRRLERRAGDVRHLGRAQASRLDQCSRNLRARDPHRRQGDRHLARLSRAAPSPRSSKPRRARSTSHPARPICS